ncbi:MAG TPA: LysM peptidoglycan-binding domain-containing protein [Spirochaetia bacterium]|nr:LysM peptidoglycan-binding domain-containing protein [Spirochaetia bacterium]
MSKGQNASKRVKNILKFFKLNENTISTIMGGVVVVVIAGLIFNYFRTANLKSWQGTLLSDQEAATIANTDTQNDKIIATYKVVKGDDLWHIAEKFYRSGYNYVDIMKENKISGDGVIVAGQELKIPKVEAKKITVAETKEVITKTDVNTDTAIAVGEYTTQKGDSYWSIAVRAYGDGFQWPKIYWANKALFSNPDMIFANTKITIPALQK